MFGCSADYVSVFQSLRLMRRPLLFFSSSYSGYLMAVTHQQQPVQVVVGWPRSGPGAPRGGLGGPRGASGGGLGILSTTTKVSARASRRTPSFERLLGGSLGAPWGVLGGPWGSPGAPRRPSGHPGAPLTIRGPTLEGLWGGLGGPKNRPRPYF